MNEPTEVSERTGVARVAEAFARAAADGRRAALMPYLMGGYPDIETSKAIGRAYADAGADLVELGVPFSDPLADGPVIHAAATQALAAGANLPAVLEVGREIARRIPVILMCYANPIYARGIERSLDLLVEAEISGLIVPDLPFEEAGEVRAACAARELAYVPLVAPTTPAQRMAQIGTTARGFMYVVGVTGTTGERASGEVGRRELLASARAATEVPVALGFGISTPEQAVEAIADGADGVIVGTRLVRAAGEAADPADAVRDLVGSFAAALTTPTAA
ncbi:MAG: tryptophan synthase subunit alpha [Solirubrobacteraceae bacterium]